MTLASAHPEPDALDPGTQEGRAVPRRAPPDEGPWGPNRCPHGYIECGALGRGSCEDCRPLPKTDAPEGGSP